MSDGVVKRAHANDMRGLVIYTTSHESVLVQLATDRSHKTRHTMVVRTVGATISSEVHV